MAFNETFFWLLTPMFLTELYRQYCKQKQYIISSNNSIKHSNELTCCKIIQMLFNCCIHTMMIHTFTVQLKNPKSCTNTVVAYVASLVRLNLSPIITLQYSRSRTYAIIPSIYSLRVNQEYELLP